MIKMMDQVYLGQSISDLSRLFMHESHYDCMVSKYSGRDCCMKTDSFVYHINIHDFYKDIREGLKRRFNLSGYSKNNARSLPIGKNNMVIGLMKDKLGGKVIPKFLALWAKLCAHN